MASVAGDSVLVRQRARESLPAYLGERREVSEVEKTILGYFFMEEAEVFVGGERLWRILGGDGLLEFDRYNRCMESLVQRGYLERMDRGASEFVLGWTSFQAGSVVV